MRNHTSAPKLKLFDARLPDVKKQCLSSKRNPQPTSYRQFPVHTEKQIRQKLPKNQENLQYEVLKKSSELSLGATNLSKTLLRSPRLQLDIFEVSKSS